LYSTPLLHEHRGALLQDQKFEECGFAGRFIAKENVKRADATTDRRNTY
jgi:hypothetical protein